MNWHCPVPCDQCVACCRRHWRRASRAGVGGASSECGRGVPGIRTQGFCRRSLAGSGGAFQWAHAGRALRIRWFDARGQTLSRPQRGAGSDSRQTRTADCRSGGAQLVVQRATGNRQDAAGQSSARITAAAIRMRGAGSGSDSIGRQRGSLDSLAAAAVQATAPFGVRAGIGRWQLETATRRNHPRPPWRTVSR